MIDFFALLQSNGSVFSIKILINIDEKQIVKLGAEGLSCRANNRVFHGRDPQAFQWTFRHEAHMVAIMYDIKMLRPVRGPKPGVVFQILLKNSRFLNFS